MAYITVDRGTTIRLVSYVKNMSDVLADAATITCEIIGPTGGTYMTESAMTNSSTGVYLFDKQTLEADTPGIYEIIVRSTSNSFTSLVRFNGFKLE